MEGPESFKSILERMVGDGFFEKIKPRTDFAAYGKDENGQMYLFDIYGIKDGLRGYLNG